MTPKALFLAVVVVLLAGCASPGPQVRVQISGGQRLEIDMKTGSVVGAKKPPVKVRVGGLMVEPKTKQASYLFSLEFKPGDVPARVKVEDVSDRVASTLVDDAQPKLKDRSWSWKSEPIDASAPLLRWVHELDDSFRVFRFTIVMADGRESVQYQSSYYAGFMKNVLRSQLGLEP